MRYAPLGICLILPLAACSQREYYVMDPPKRAFSTYGALEVKPFTIDGLDTLDPAKRAKALELADYITNELRERLSPKYFGGEGKKLVVTGKLVGFDPGSQALRYWVGFGAGKGEILAEAYFDDEEGAVAKAMGKGAVSGGWFGGSVNSAGRRVAKAVVDFVSANHASVVDQSKHPGVR